MKKQTKTTDKVKLSKEEQAKLSTEKKEKKKLLKKIELSSLDLIPIKGAIENGSVGFELVNDLGSFNIFQLLSFDYISATDEELTEHIFIWDRLYRTNSRDLKKVGISMPVDLRSNIEYYRNKYDKIKNPLYREKLKETIDEFRSLKDRESKDFYLFVYAENRDMLEKLNIKIMTSLVHKNLAIEIPYRKKLSVLSRFSNPYNSTINE